MVAPMALLSSPSPRATLLASIAVGALALAAAPSCQPGALGGVGAKACPQLNPNVDALSANYSANAKANAKVRAFVTASKDLMLVSELMEKHATDACTNMARDLQIPPQQLQPRSDQPGARVQAACGAVAAAMDQILSAGVRIQASVTPPQCTANVQAEARCEGVCQASVTPAEIIANCEPGKLSGTCVGRCTGACEGQCTGDCQGQCAQVDAYGRCAGQCNGTCAGTCNGTCKASCQGEWQAPRCEGQIRGPSVDAECDASCRAHANFQAQCTPANVQLQVTGNHQMAAALAATLRANLPLLLHAEFTLGKRVLGDARAVVEVGRALPNIIGQAGLQASACVAAAANATVQASARINVSIKASASVSGRAGASL